MKGIFFGLLFLPFLSFSQSECWVAADQKLVFLLPDMSKPHTLPSPLFMPVTGSANPEITWSWSPTAGLIDPSTKIEKANILRPMFDLDKLGDLSGIAIRTAYTITGYIPRLNLYCPPATVNVYILPKIHPYEAFTPNGDDFNIRWYIDNITSYPNAEVLVYDRWGSLVYENYSNYEEKPFWGRLNGKDLPTGPYMYRIKPHPEYPDVVGTLTIIR
jgi:gliding motility-associated-like protein